MLLLIRAFARVGQIKSGTQSEPRVRGVTAHVENHVPPCRDPRTPARGAHEFQLAGDTTNTASDLMMLTMKLAKTKSVNSGSGTSAMEKYFYRETSHLSSQGRENIQLPMQQQQQQQMSRIRTMTHISCTGFTLATITSANTPEPMRLGEIKYMFESEELELLRASGKESCHRAGPTAFGLSALRGAAAVLRKLDAERLNPGVICVKEIAPTCANAPDRSSKAPY